MSGRHHGHRSPAPPVTKPPALLLFDLGGVLVENTVFERLSALLADAVDPATLKRRWLASHSVRRFEVGEIGSEAFAESFIGEWRLALSPAEFIDEFRQWPRDFYPGARETLRVLRRRYRVGCLSNSNALHWRRFGGFADDFDIALSSHLLGALKPDAEIFARALAACAVAPAAVWFFDDLPDNVAAAARLGMRAHQVEGFAATLAVLRSTGVLPC